MLRGIFSELRRQTIIIKYIGKIGLTLKRIVFSAASKSFTVRCLFLDADLMQLFYCIFSNNVFMPRIMNITNRNTSSFPLRDVVFEFVKKLSF